MTGALAPELLIPDWPAPADVVAFATTRTNPARPASAPTRATPNDQARISSFADFNLGYHVGDDVNRVRSRRKELAELLPGDMAIQWLKQTHGTELIETTRARAADGPVPLADAAFTRDRGVACAVLTADCLPVLFCAADGGQVAVAHAGWRGLAAGILEKTLARFSPGEVMAWLGPAIGPCHFEVGEEVRQAFLGNSRSVGEKHELESHGFIPANDDGSKWMADLYAIARVKLRSSGVRMIYGGGYCTFCTSGTSGTIDGDSTGRGQPLFYSYRRAAPTGRMASLILLSPQSSS